MNKYLSAKIFATTIYFLGWTVTLTFDQDVSGINAWNGRKAKCDGNVCTFKFPQHKKKFKKGEAVNLGFGLNFPQTTSPPEIVSASITSKKPVGEYDLCAAPEDEPDEPTTGKGHLKIF